VHATQLTTKTGSVTAPLNGISVSQDNRKPSNGRRKSMLKRFII